MEHKDYGQFVQRMRKSRGLTQEQLVSVSGVSIATVKSFEASGDRIKLRASNLDAILTAFAMRSYLGPSEIQIIANGADRTFDSIERLNIRAEQLSAEQHNDLRTRPGTSAEPTREERLLAAFRVLEDTNQSETALVMIEALAKQAGDQLADELRTPKKAPKESRFIRVAQPEKEGPVPGSISQEFSHYEADEDGHVQHKRPIDTSDPARSRPDGGEQDHPNTGQRAQTGTD